jgi:hypothetical protein
VIGTTAAPADAAATAAAMEATVAVCLMVIPLLLA